MKKILTIAVLGGLFAASTLQAQVSIYIAGSTAFRANVFRAVKAAFDSTPTIVPATASTGTGVYTMTGTMSSLYGGQSVSVYASFNGSVQGLEDILNNTSITFTNATAGGAAVSAVPTITFSDVDKVSTLAANAAVTETHVAILPFTFCRNYYAPTTVTNITGHQLQSLWNNGALKLSFFTGNDADTNNEMYVTGRNKDSGSRVCAAADTYYTGTPILYGFNTTAPTVFAIMNQNLSPSIYGPGYSSGGNEAAALTNQNAMATNLIGSFVGAACVGYEGLNDALTVAGDTSTASTYPNGGGGCSIVAYDGFLPFNGYTPGVTTQVPAKPDFTPIIKGQYSLWSYECMETANTHTSDTTYQYYTNFVGQLDNDILQSEVNNGNSSTYGPVTAIRLSEMKCSRSSVGGAITPN